MTITVNIFDSGAAQPTGPAPASGTSALEGGPSVELDGAGTADAVTLASGPAVNAGPPAAELVQTVEAALAIARAPREEESSAAAGVSGGAAPI